MRSCPFCARPRGDGCTIFEERYGLGHRAPHSLAHPGRVANEYVCWWARFNYHDMSELEAAMYKVKMEDAQHGQDR